MHTVINYNDHVGWIEFELNFNKTVLQIGNPDAICPRQEAIKKLWLETPEYKDFMEKKKVAKKSLIRTLFFFV